MSASHHRWVPAAVVSLLTISVAFCAAAQPSSAAATPSSTPAAATPASAPPPAAATPSNQAAAAVARTASAAAHAVAAVIPAGATPTAAATKGTGPSEEEKKRRAEERAALDLEARHAAAAASEAAAAAAAAEAAHKRALEEARQARSAAERAVATERARVEAGKLELAQFRRKLAERRKRASARARKRFERYNTLSARVREPLKPAQVDALYMALVKDLEGLRDTMAVELRSIGRAPELPKAALEGPETPGLKLATELQRSDLELAAAAVRAERDELDAANRKQHQADCANTAEQLRRLNDLRAGLIDRLSPAVHSELFGLTSAGLAQLRRELRHVELLARWYPTARVLMLTVPRNLDQAILKLSKIAVGLLRGLLFLLVWWLIRRRWRGWVEAARTLVAPRMARSYTWRAVDLALRLALTLGRELAWLLTIMVFFEWVLEAGLAVELDQLYDLLWIWACYRLILAAVHRFFTSAARLRLRTRHVEVSAELSGRILASARLVARYVLVVWVLLSIADHLVGRGYIYLLVVRLAWIGALPVAVLLVRRWQQDICEAYLSAFPVGSLAEVVRSAQGKPHGLVVAFAAFAYVALRGVALWAGDMATSFDATRRVLAYLFRRELERRADEVRVKTSLDDLPGPVRDAFTVRPASEHELVDELPDLPEVAADIRAWAAGGPSRAIAVTGPWGGGKTTWIRALARRVLAEEDAAFVLINMQFLERPGDESTLYQTLGAQLGHPEVQTLAHLVTLLRDGERRLILLDDAGRLILRAMGGTAAWAALNEVIGQTRGDVFWVVAASQHAMYLAENVLPKRDTYDRVVRLRPWTEEQIGSLIGQRMENCGAEANFEDLWETTDRNRDSFDETMRAGERFMRMLWDDTDGNPRDALYFWVRSLVPSGGEQVLVHLFTAHNADQLEHLRELSRFCLRAVLEHDGLSVDEVARVLNEGESEVSTTLRWLEEQGVLERATWGERDRWQVSAAWHRAAVRYLKRKHLLSA